MSIKYKKLLTSILVATISISPVAGFILPTSALAQAVSPSRYYPVTVNYVDEQGAELHAPVTLNEMNYVASNLSIPGYRSTEPSNYKGVADHSGIVVTYVYQKIAAPASTNYYPVTVNYVDEQGAELHAPITLSALNYTAPSLSISGYRTSNPSNYTGVADHPGIVVTYVYQKIAAPASPNYYPVTVNYVDEQGAELHAPVTLNEMNYVASNLSIPGYRSTEPSNYKGVADHPGIVVTYVYQKIAGGTITVKYVDENSKVIAPKTEINGDLNSTYNITLKDIPGYTYVKGEDIGIPMTGVFNGDDKVKVFTYKSNTKDVEKFVYQFMDREGKEIAPSIFTHDEVDVNLLLKTFPIKVGYQLNLELSRIKNGVIKTGSIDKKVQTFKLIYDESIESNQVITAYSRVKTINNMSVWTQPEKTNGANKVDALSFYAGKNLRILREAKTISGTYYQFSIDGKTIGWIDSKALDTFYTPSMEKNLTATRYVAPGQETQHYYELPVADSAIDRGPLSKFSGQTLTVQREATIEGELWYRVKGLGWTKASNLTATQYDKPEYDKATTSYNRVKTATVKPTIPGTQQIPTKQSGTLKIKATHQEQPIVAENLKLPTTGDNLWDSVLYSVFGFITVCLSFVLFFRRKKQKNS